MSRVFAVPTKNLKESQVEMGPPIFSREYKRFSGDIPLDERYRIRDYIEIHDPEITLNGEKASIAGYRMDFGTVWNLSGDRREQYTWQQIERIVRSGGAFKS